jgi:hypothetical protein
VKFFAFEMARNDVTARPRFVNEAQFDVFTRKFFDEFIDGFERAADDAVVTDLGGVLRRDGHRDGFFVDVQSDILHCFAHGCLVSFIDDESGA